MDDSPDSSGGDRPLTALAAALWTIVLWFVEIVCLGVTQAARPGATGDMVNIAACTALATSLVVFVMVRVHARETSLRATMGVAPIAPLHLVLSVAAGAGMYPLLSTVRDLVLKRWPFADADTEALEKLYAVTTPGSRVALVVAAFVVVPLAEEAFFRGILFGGIRRTSGARAATLATAVFFAVSELDWRPIPTMLVLGLALARLRERTGTVLAPIAAHIAFYAVAGVPILAGADPNADVVYATRWIVGGAVIALLALVAVGLDRRDE